MSATSKFIVTEPEIDLYLGDGKKKELQSVRCEYIRLNRAYNPDNPQSHYQATHVAPDGTELTTVKVTPEDLEDAIGDWLKAA